MVKPFIAAADRGGNKRTVDVRAIIDRNMYILSAGCHWTALPKDLPPSSTVNRYFLRMSYDLTLERLHHALYAQCHE